MGIQRWLPSGSAALVSPAGAADALGHLLKSLWKSELIATGDADWAESRASFSSA